MHEINLESFLVLIVAAAFFLLLFLGSALLLWTDAQPTLYARFVVDDVSPFIQAEGTSIGALLEKALFAHSLAVVAVVARCLN